MPLWRPVRWWESRKVGDVASTPKSIALGFMAKDFPPGVTITMLPPVEVSSTIRYHVKDAKGCHQTILLVEGSMLFHPMFESNLMKALRGVAHRVYLEHQQDAIDTNKGPLAAQDQTAFDAETMKVFKGIKALLVDPFKPSHPLIDVPALSPKEIMIMTRQGYAHRDRDDERTVDLGDEAIVVHATAKALLLDLDGEEHWIPRSVLRKGSTVGDCAIGEQGCVVLPEWFAKKEGLV